MLLFGILNATYFGVKNANMPVHRPLFAVLNANSHFMEFGNAGVWHLNASIWRLNAGVKSL